MGFENSLEVEVKVLGEFRVEGCGLGRELELEWTGAWDGDLGLSNPLNRPDESDLVAWCVKEGEGG